MSAALDQLRAALAVKRGDAPPKSRVSVPDPIIYATDGTDKELKMRGRVVGTITYDRKPS